ncbi:MAG: O-antigen ligase family protein [Flavobacteriia bacterium]|nr:O-antigen ligase family protein [Flavobacteriia bacterium]
MTLNARQITFAAAGIVLPVVVLKYLGSIADVAMLGSIGVLIAYWIVELNWTKFLFLAAVATYLFSIEVPLFGGSSASLPGEPLVALLAAASLFEAYKQRPFVRQLLKEPIAWASLLLIASWVLSAATSTMPKVSIKYVAINVVFMSAGLLVFPILWARSEFSLKSFISITWPICLFFALYGVANLIPYGFNPGAAALIGQPFLKDHTVFSATFSLFVPLLLLWKKYNLSMKKWESLLPISGVFMLLTLFISSSRAAWLALILAGVFYAFIVLGGTLRLLAATVVVAGIALYLNTDRINESLQVNPYSSTEVSGSLETQVLSVGNVNSDVSNIERLNRWKCAVRMGLDKPISGFGPGTYQFEYIPYQRNADMTYISVTSPFTKILGRGGSAHSEYLLLLAESGFIGLLAWILLQLAALLTFFKVWNRNVSTDQRYMALAVYLSIFTFSIHSLFNNYLNTVQFGFTWWLLVGALMYMSFAFKPENHD